MANIIIINRDTSPSDTLTSTLAIEGYQLWLVESPERIGELARREAPDLVIIDIVTSSMDASYLCRRARALPALFRVPILCLISATSAQDIAQILDAGGDDCLRKPFVGRELAARVRALLRRKAPAASIAPLVLDPRGKTVQLYGNFVDLTPTEYDLLEALCQNPGEHVTATDLLERVWRYPPGVGDPALVRNHVRNLRRKLERDPNRPRIVTSAHGRGYTVSVNIERR